LVFKRKAWTEDAIIPWPIKTDSVEADQLLKKAGYPGPYGAVTLRHPVGLHLDEPYYIFLMMTGEYIFVGVNDRKVIKSASNKEAVGHEGA
jgi:hypothetical protein